MLAMLCHPDLVCLRREAMQWAEPAVIDIHGAEWVKRGKYELVNDATRYECYERSFAAQV